MADTILEQDIRLLQSRVMDDVPEGGGAPVGTVIVDGASNAVFDDTNDLDTANGNVSLRKVFVHVATANAAKYAGANVMVAEPPGDDLLSLTLFQTDNFFDTRSAAVSRLESYLSAGGTWNGYLYERHISGQQIIQLIQRVDTKLPGIGAVFALVQDETYPAEIRQYVRVKRVSYEVVTFTDDSGDFVRWVVSCEITAPLATDFKGQAASRQAMNRSGDSAVQNARILSYESMSDVNTGTNPMPTAVQLAGGAYLYKSATTDTAARRWMLVGDGRLFHFWWFNGSYFHSMSFGEFISWRPGDAFNTLLAAQVASNTYCGSLVYNTGTNTNYATSYGGGLTLQRGNDQLTTSVLTCLTSLVFSSNSGAGIAGLYNYSAMPHPSDVTGGFELCPVYVRSNCASQSASRRGIMPGVYHSSADMSAFDELEIGGIPSNPGALFLSWPIQTGSSIGRAQIDMIGPWR